MSDDVSKALAQLKAVEKTILISLSTLKGIIDTNDLPAIKAMARMAAIRIQETLSDADKDLSKIDRSN